MIAAWQASGVRAIRWARSSPPTRLLAGGYDIRTVQERLGHTDVKTTMISISARAATRRERREYEEG